MFRSEKLSIPVKGLLFALTLSLAALAANAQCIPAAERAALVALHSNTFGDSWINNTNWLSADEATWFGVTITSCHVTAISLPGNNLDGPLPSQLGDLTELVSLNLVGNELIGAVPTSLVSLTKLTSIQLQDNNLSDLPAFTSSTITTLKVENNKLTFEDLASNVGVTGISYIPQQNLPGNELTLIDGIYQPITYFIPGSNIQYSWYKGGIFMPGVTGSTVNLNAEADAGTYVVEITTPDVPGLTIKSDPTVVKLSAECISATERDALISFYNSTNGPQWYQNSNWLTGDPRTWYGVESLGCRITGISLQFNNLGGPIPAAIGDLASLTNLYLNDNKLSGDLPTSMATLGSLAYVSLSNNKLTGAVPAGIGFLTSLYYFEAFNNKITDIPEFISTNIYSLNVKDNLLSFGDIELNLGKTGFQFDPQGKLPSQNVAVAVGAPIDLVMSTDGISNTYQWYKDGTIIAGETNTTLSIATATVSDEGTYTIRVTNPLVGKTLESNPYVVTVQSTCVPAADRAALLALYYETNGAAWTDNSGWLSADESTWTGVTVTGCRVTQINLSAQNLAGEIPGELGALDALVTLDLSSNFLTGKIPDSFGGMTALQFLSIRTNQLTGSIPAGVASLPSLQYLYVDYNALSGQIPAITSPVNSVLVGGNYFGFPDLELNQGLVPLIYTPQYYNTSLVSISYYEGEKLVLTGNSAGGTGNTYQWYQADSGGTYQPIPGATSLTLAINSVQASNAGYYFLGAMNPDFPGLEIQSYFMYLTVNPRSSCVPIAERRALTSLFGSTKGTQWSNRFTSNWTLTDDESEWAGVTIAGCHVTELDLHDNGLDGDLPTEIGDLTSLTKLDLSGNRISGILPASFSNLTTLTELNLSYNEITDVMAPSWNALNNLSVVQLNNNLLASLPAFTNGIITQLSVGGNQLGFDDLEPNVGLSGYTYSPQTISTPDQTITVTLGSAASISPAVAGSANQYKWYKNNVLIAGANNSSYDIVSTILTDENIYSAKVTSTLLPGLTLTTNKFILALDVGSCIPPTERAALLWTYYSTRGKKWYFNSGWLNTDESTWYGVTTAGCHVTEISLNGNNMNGTIPAALTDLDNLTRLDIPNNQLKGSIPAGLDNLSQLTYLSLNYNQLTGSIPTEIGNINSLQELDLSFNNLSGSIPASFGDLSSLTRLDLSNNQNYDATTRLSGIIPPELGNLTLLESLYLNGNQLSGPIPARLGDIPTLAHLYLGSNSLTGNIPVELGNPPGLADLFLSSNYLTGSIPSSLKSISYIDLSFNQLSGTIPMDLGGTGSEVVTLTLDYNSLTGGLSAAIGDWTNLQSFSAASNLLSGTLPAEMGNLSSLTFLNLSENNFSGTIPPELGNLTSVYSLNLGGNEFTGTVPPELSNLTGLISLELTNNQLSGPLPPDVVNMTSLTHLGLGDNQFNGPIPASYGSFTTLFFLNLGTNHLTGTIPAALGNLTTIQNLYLDHNQLTGDVPPEFANLVNLHGLTLDDNQLTGDLPTAIGAFPFLSQLAIQNNFLTGIPNFNGPTYMYTFNVSNNKLTFGDLEPNAARPVFTASPQAKLPAAPVSINAGCPLNLTIATDGASNSYQWWKDGVPIAGAAGSTLTIDYTSASEAGNYYVIVTNSVVTTVTLQSDDVAVTVTGVPITPPVAGDVNGCTGSSVVLTATGAPDGQYVWYDNAGNVLSGEVNGTYTTPALTLTETYSVAITDGTCRSAKVVTQALISPPPGDAGGSDVSACVPGDVTLTATGGSAGEYRWYAAASGGTPLPGETNATYVAPNVSTTTTFFVALNSGACESVNRTPITIQYTAVPPPVATGDATCVPASLTLTASGGTDGNYNWYSVASGGSPIAGEVNGTFITPVLSGTATYYVSISDATCESVRVPAIATVGTTPSKPVITSGGSPASATIDVCSGLVTLSGPVGYATYNWSSGDTSGDITPLASGIFTVAVAGTDGCESAPSDPVQLTFCSNGPPVIEAVPLSTSIDGTITIDLKDLITDPENNLDLSTLTLVSQPTSGAPATIDSNGILTISYQGLSFSGKDQVVISVCDFLGSCTQNTFNIDVIGDIIVYNGISPNGDADNNAFRLEFITQIAAAKDNHVTIFNRWGDTVWEGTNYNNSSVVFTGVSKSGAELPSGTYFYKVTFNGARPTMTGFISIKR